MHDTGVGSGVTTAEEYNKWVEDGQKKLEEHQKKLDIIEERKKNVPVVNVVKVVPGVGCVISWTGCSEYVNGYKVMVRPHRGSRPIYTTLEHTHPKWPLLITTSTTLNSWTSVADRSRPVPVTLTHRNTLIKETMWDVIVQASPHERISNVITINVGKEPKLIPKKEEVVVKVPEEQILETKPPVRKDPTQEIPVVKVEEAKAPVLTVDEAKEKKKLSKQEKIARRIKRKKTKRAKRARRNKK